MELGTVLGNPGRKLSYSPDSRLVLPKTFIGVEVEVENFQRMPSEEESAMKVFWEAKHDDSLREGGLEYIFREPLFGTDILSALDILTQMAIKYKWAVSYRTSEHIHLDMRPESFSTFKGLCGTYAICERVLYDWVGASRAESIFCLPWWEAENDIKQISALFYQQNEDFSKTAGNINRYSGLNLNALAKFGSIEFRHLQTTFDMNRIVEWINICLSLLKYARSIKDVDNIGLYLLDTFSVQGAEAFLLTVFGREIGTELLKTAQDLDLYNGVALAQDLLRQDLLASLKLVFEVPKHKYLKKGDNSALSAWIKARISHKKSSGLRKHQVTLAQAQADPVNPNRVFHPFRYSRTTDNGSWVFSFTPSPDFTYEHTIHPERQNTGENGVMLNSRLHTLLYNFFIGCISFRDHPDLLVEQFDTDEEARRNSDDWLASQL